MRIGAVFPQTEVGADPGAVRAFAEAMEHMGLDHLVAYDHVVGASAAAYDQERLRGPYRERHMFHEPFVLFGFLAGFTKRIELCTGVLILPQRQTVLVAKQAAEVDVLSGGRLRLGVGTGWNHVEYEALGVPFEGRGARQEEQIQLLRELWTKPLVDFKGRYDVVPNAGLNPLPVQRPIPIWLGGVAEPVMRRVGALGDGWLPMFSDLEVAVTRESRSSLQPKEAIARMRDYARAAGRDPATIGVECRIAYAGQTSDDWNRIADIYRDAGVTHLTLVTVNAGLTGPDQHIEAVQTMKSSI